MSALEATPVMETQIVVIQWDLTCVHVILVIPAMDSTAQVSLAHP